MSTMLMYARGVLAHFLDDEAPVDVSWDPEERYADLLESGALAEETSARGATARNAAYRNGLADKSLTADADAKLGSPQQQAQMYHTATEYSYEPLARYNALAHTFKAHKGAKSVEETEALRQSDPCYGSLMPSKERPGAFELPYDPLRRFHAMSKGLKLPRGHKSAEHLEVLRVSDPSYGSLMPSKERAGPHELTYDPVRRYAALAKLLKEPRGAKTTEHMAILRLSDPSYGSLMPSKERAGPHELTYDPVRRYNALAKVLKPYRGAKTSEHLEILRVSDPCYGSLMPSKERPGPHELTYDPGRRYAGLAKTLKTPRGGKPFEHLRNLRISDPSLGTLMPKRLQEAKLVQAAEIAEEARVEALEEEDEWSRARSHSLGSARLSGRLPRILSNQAFQIDDEEDDELSPIENSRRHERPWAPPPPMRNREYYREAMPPRSTRRFSNDSTDEPTDDASMRSFARTSLERASERSSNDTITSFLDDHDVYASGDWSARDFRAELKAELGAGPSQLLSPRQLAAIKAHAPGTAAPTEPKKRGDTSNVRPEAAYSEA